MLARERVKSPGGVLRLVTVRVRWAANEELMKADGGAADSFEADEEESKMASNGKKDTIQQSKWKLKFDYVTSLGP